MDEARTGELDVAVVRAERFELIDRKGRVRAVLGDLGGPSCYVPGLGLRDVHGHERTGLMCSADGPSLVLVVDGNEVFRLGVSDDEGVTDDDDDYDPTVHMVFADGDGQPRVAIEVHYDGRAELDWG